ncbi:MAG: MBL fold metallo-hydrolase RNA specificity domain-containing protein [Desulfovibrionaceae bacterium]
MKIQFLGAAQTVTGSCYIIEAAGKRFAIDCGMHQGNKEIEKRNRLTDAYLPEKIDFILVTHAHIDHSGLLPRMVKEGFKGKIYCTPPTRDLLEIMLLDSAHIQEMEAEWQAKKATRHGKNSVPPLYTQEHALKVPYYLSPVEYDKPITPAPGITVLYKDAGHILGSAFIELTVQENGDTTKLVFSGDLGRPNALLLRDPDDATAAHYLFLESTYGNRDHKDENSSREELAAAIRYSYDKGEKVIIPAFAVERTQEIIYTLYELHKAGKLPQDMPVFLDSPLAISATEIFRKYPRYFDEQTKALLAHGEDPLNLPNLKFTKETSESQAINTTPGPAIVISASGMCNAGRIKHHLRHNLWREGASVVFVGYQAQGTPGRKIVDGLKHIRILGDEVAVRAKIFTIGGFSAHAGQSQILDWLRAIPKTDMEIFLVHGEPQAQQVLAGLIRKEFAYKVHTPSYLEECYLRPGTDMEVVESIDRAEPRIDWTFMVQETEHRLQQLRQRLGDVQAKPWVDQVDLRDRLLDIHREIIELITEL